MRAIAAVALCAMVGAAHTASVGCSWDGGLLLCLEADGGVEGHIASCLDDGTFPGTAVAGQVAVRGMFGVEEVEFLQALGYAGAAANVTCADRTATVQLEAAALVKSIPLSVGGLTRVTLQVTRLPNASVALAWSGTLLAAEFARFDKINLGLAVTKAGFDAPVSTTVAADVRRVSAHLDLPGTVVLAARGFLFGGGAFNLSNGTCELAAVSGPASLDVRVSDILGSFAGARATFDVCAMLQPQHLPAGTPFFTLHAEASTPVWLRSLALASANITVAVARDGQDTDDVEWSGELSAHASLFGQDRSVAHARVSQSQGVEALYVYVDVREPGVSVEGTVAYTSQECGPWNAGDVAVRVRGFDSHTFTGQLMQRESVHAGAACGWNASLGGASRLIEFAGLVLADYSLSLGQTQGGGGVSSWSGSVDGQVEVRSLGLPDGDLQAHVAFDAAAGAGDFSVDGTLRAGLVAGTVALQGQAGTQGLELAGAGQVRVGVLGLVGGLFDVDVAYVQQGPAVWRISSSTSASSVLPLVHVHGMQLGDAQVDLVGLQQQGSLVWAGAVSGRAEFARVGLEVSAAVEGGALSALAGRGHISRGGVTYSGGIEVSTNATDGCVTVVGTGQAALKYIPSVALNATLTVAQCGNGSDPEYTLAATWDGVLLHQSLQLDNGEMVLSGSLANVAVDLTQRDALAAADASLAVNVSTDVDLDWTGVVHADVNLFGGSALAEVAVVQGRLGRVDVATRFVAGNGLLSSRLAFTYTDSCSDAAGAGDVTLRLAGAAALSFNASVFYNKCSGVVRLEGAHAGSWQGPGAFFGSELQIAIRSAAHGGAAKLGPRVWAGEVTAGVALPGAGAGARLSFNTSTDALDAGLHFSSRHLSVVATVDGCGGTGLVVLKGLPHNIPAVEAGVTLSLPGCGGSPGVNASIDASGDGNWVATGPLDVDLRIPYFGRTVVLRSPTVTVRSQNGTKSVAITGAFLTEYGLVLSVALPEEDGELPTVLLGGGVAGVGAATAAVSPAGFMAAWQGDSAFTNTALGVLLPVLFDDLAWLQLESASVDVSFDGTVSLRGAGRLYGLDASVALSVSHTAEVSANGTHAAGFGLAVQVATPAGTDEFLAERFPAGTLRDLLLHVAPASAELTIAGPGGFELDGARLQGGLAVAAFVGANSRLLQSAKVLAPAVLAEQIEEAEAAGDAGRIANVTGRGLKLVAAVRSATDIGLYAVLAGELRLPGGAAVVLRELALAFELRAGLAVPAVGVRAAVEVTLHGDTLVQASGFVGLSEAGLEVELPAVSVSVAGRRSPGLLWADPLGVRGVQAVLPLQVRLAVDRALAVRAFALVGDFQLGGATGSLQIGVDVGDFGKAAMRAELDSVDLRTVVSEIACPTQPAGACLGRIGRAAADIRLQRFVGWLNPNLHNATSITAASLLSNKTVTVSVPAGINLEAEELSLWSAIRVHQARLHVSAAGGLQAVLRAAPASWGPLHITGADGASGPEVALALTPAEQSLVVDGRATVLGQTVAVALSVEDGAVTGQFEYNVGGLAANVSLAGTTDAQGSMAGVLQGRVEVQVLDNAVDSLTQAILKLEDKAAGTLAAAQAALAKAVTELEEAQAHLESVRAWATDKLAAAQQGLDKAQAAADIKRADCAALQPDCDAKKFGACLRVTLCKNDVRNLETAVKAAQLLLDGAQSAVDAAIDVAVKALDTVQAGFEKAHDAVDAAQVDSDGFQRLTQLVGGALTGLVNVHYVAFRAPLGAAPGGAMFRMEMTLANTLVTAEFEGDLTLPQIHRGLRAEVRKHVGILLGVAHILDLLI